MLYSSPVKIDLKADAISPINVAQRFGILPAVWLVNNLYVNAALTERLSFWPRPHFLVLVLGPTSGTVQADDTYSSKEPHPSAPISE